MAVYFFPTSQRICLKHFILSFRWLDEMFSISQVRNKSTWYKFFGITKMDHLIH